MATERKEPAGLENPTTTAAAEAAKSEKPLDNHSNHGHDHHEEYFPSERSFLSWASVCLIGFAGLILSLSVHHLYESQLKAGDTLDHDLYASQATVIVDQTGTARARDAVTQAAMPVFKSKVGADEYTQTAVKEILDTIALLHQAGIVPANGLSAPAQTKWLLASEPEFKQKSAQPDLHPFADQLAQQRTSLQAFRTGHKDLPEQAVLLAVSVTPKTTASYSNTVQNATTRICKKLQRLPLTSGIWTDLVVEFMPDDWPEPLRTATAHMVCARLRPNVEIDTQQTQRRSQELAGHVKPIMRNIAVGQILAKKGEPLSQNNIDVLKAMGMERVNRWPFVVGLAISITAGVFLVALFLYAIEPNHLFAAASVGLLYTVAINVFAVSSIWGKLFPQFVPLPSAALILTIFLGQRIAIVVCLSLGILLAVDGMLDFSNMVALCTAAGAAILFYSRKRHALISTGLIMALAQGLGYLGAAGSQGTLAPEQLAQGVGFEFFGGLVLAIVSIGSLPFLESIFGMITPFRLAELTDADQPLLRKLEENAPGTYQHSLAVANLAEAGARAIGADVNLVRAGAYYHDVGKMVRPRYFIENQLGDKNPHDEMSPEDSRERVLAHVTDGLALAKEYKLPKAVQDFIPMHQGTSLMAYFYHKACVRDGSDNVNPSDYRYPGPSPQSKETAIVMLADVSEAVTHSMKDPSQEEVEEAMSKVFQNRWDDGQFSEAGLTHNELQRVKRAFVHVWRTLHHERLKYPSTTTGRMAVPPNVVSSAAASAAGAANAASTPSATSSAASSASTAPTPAEQAKSIEPSAGDCCG